MFRLMRPTGSSSSGLSTLITRPANNFVSNGSFDHQIRSYWQIVLTKKPDKETGKLVFDRWTYLIRGHQEPRLGNGMTFSQRDAMNRRHLKPWMKKRIATEKKEWNRKCREADELLNYVQFMREAGAYNKK
mmetsp:Transcript_7007/g.9112  ORF Transcript_7007/g.9112 Transcript_7007/m.9112 type:complete len:131 (+) Transcript_7007:208-600(+)|eukprot:CAMPEP_0198137678 /NCGR_PEP_ID=MMETSP1443-20131203/1146_1 /TAXON_ID=186043 /ORGANISM="Entomoneis sp., Strain CCMP2396" /LENGTH=130 /DNA_ID=CAMNT_0043799187 /DNA_START=142 /DNA_END=534 /DNA_ORIENTATION=+